MILCNISDANTYRNISPLLNEALEWLLANTSSSLANGSYPVGDNGVVVKAETPALMPRERVRLEAHRRYIDIHVPLKGIETIGWAPVGSLSYLAEPYSDDTDVAFYSDSAHSLIHVHPGQIAIFFPEDAHAPNIGIGNHRKLCIKIPCL